MGLGLGLGFSSNKSKSSSTGTIDQTSMPVVPEWMQQLTQDLVKRRTTYGSQTPQDFVARTNPLLDQATNFASRLAPSASFGTASGIASDVASGADVDLVSGMDRFKNGYQRDVIDAALKDFDFGAGQTRAQQDLDLAGGGGFQGSGLALTKSATEDALTRGRGSMSATLNKQGWDDMLGAAIQQATLNLGKGNQQLGAAQTLGNLGTAEGADQRATVDALASSGERNRAIEGEMRQAPLTLADWEQQMPDWLTALIGEHTTGTTTSQTKGKQTGFNASASFK